MMRVYVLAALPLLVICGMLVILTCTQAHDDSALRNLLLPEDCPAPCLLGIRPGETRGDEALKILESHKWVTNINIVYRGRTNPGENRDGTLGWSWNGSQPAILRSPVLIAGEISIDGGVVSSIRLATFIPFGDVWLVLGKPRHGWMRPSRAYLGELNNHLASYATTRLAFRTLLPEPPRADSFWTAPVEIRFEAEADDDYSYHLPCWMGCS